MTLTLEEALEAGLTITGAAWQREGAGRSGWWDARGSVRRGPEHRRRQWRDSSARYYAANRQAVAERRRIRRKERAEWTNG